MFQLFQSQPHTADIFSNNSQALFASKRLPPSLNFLAASVGEGGANLPQNLSTLRSALQSLGYPQQPDIGAGLDGALLDGIGQFQADHGLVTDGLVGPKTATAMRQAFEPGFDPALAEQRYPSLATQPVGFGAENRDADVFRVAAGLKHLGYMRDGDIAELRADPQRRILMDGVQHYQLDQDFDPTDQIGGPGEPTGQLLHFDLIRELGGAKAPPQHDRRRSWRLPGFRTMEIRPGEAHADIKPLDPARSGENRNVERNQETRKPAVAPGLLHQYSVRQRQSQPITEASSSKIVLGAGPHRGAKSNPDSESPTKTAPKSEANLIKTENTVPSHQNMPQPGMNLGSQNKVPAREISPIVDIIPLPKGTGDQISKERYDFILQFDKKNPGERQEAFNHPVQGIHAGWLGIQAKMETKSAYKPKGGDKPKLQNNEADAYRHALWAYRMTKAHGPYYAKKFGDAHEITKPGPDGERLMDLNNNRIGRELAMDPRNEGRKDSEVIREAIREGRLRLSPFEVTDSDPGEEHKYDKEYGEQALKLKIGRKNRHRRNSIFGYRF